MSLIEKALRQVEMEQRKDTTSSATAGSSVLQSDSILFKKQSVRSFMIISGIILAAVFAAFVSTDLMDMGNEKISFPEIKNIQIVKGPVNAIDKVHEAGTKTDIITSHPLPPVPDQAAGSKSSNTVKSGGRNKQGAITAPSKSISETHELKSDFKKKHLYSENRYKNEEVKSKLKVLSGSYLSANALNNAGVLLLEKGDLEQARSFFNEALKFDPDNERAMNNMGLSFYMEDHSKEAVKYFKSALQINPENLESYSNLGIIFRKSKQYERAKKMFEKALLINPAHPETLYNYALLFEDIKQGETSRLFFNRFLQEAPERLKELKEKVRKHLERTI